MVLEDTNPGNSDGNTGPKLVSGKFGNAIVFDGVDDYANLSNSNLFRPTNEITINFWVNILEKKPWIAILGNLWDTGTTESGYYFGSRGSGDETGFFMKTSNINADYWGSSYLTTLKEGKWYFVSGTYDGTYIRFYLNGKLVSSTTTSGTIDYTPQPYALYLARYYDDNEDTYFKGSFDELKIFNRSLSTDEIELSYWEYFRELKEGTNNIDLSYCNIKSGEEYSIYIFTESGNKVIIDAFAK